MEPPENNAFSRQVYKTRRLLQDDGKIGAARQDSHLLILP